MMREKEGTDALGLCSPRLAIGGRVFGGQASDATRYMHVLGTFLGSRGRHVRRPKRPSTPPGLLRDGGPAIGPNIEARDVRMTQSDIAWT